MTSNLHAQVQIAARISKHVDAGELHKAHYLLIETLHLGASAEFLEGIIASHRLGKLEEVVTLTCPECGSPDIHVLWWVEQATGRKSCFENQCKCRACDINAAMVPERVKGFPIHR